MSLTTSAYVYTDPQGLSGLKKAAQERSPEALREAAKQFEALFMQMLLKSMRAASLENGGLLDSEQSLFYRDLCDQQLALTLAKQGQLGLAGIMEKQLGGEGDLPRPNSPANKANPLAFLETVNKLRAHRLSPPQSGIAGAIADDGISLQPSSPETFVQHLWSHAQNAARELGVASEVLIAQAALETAWGKSVPRFSDGRSSHNLFGIKADSRWSGERVVNATLEFENGLPVLRRDGFRAYSSYAESFSDYVNFLRSNPRYAEALSLRRDNLAFLRALQRAGYATDPNYANKIQAILNSSVFDRASNSLKSASAWPIASFKG